MAKPYFTRRRRISLKKAHIVLADKLGFFVGWGTGILNLFTNPQADLESEFKSTNTRAKKKEQHSRAALSFWLGHRDSNPGNVRVRV